MRVGKSSSTSNGIWWFLLELSERARAGGRGSRAIGSFPTPPPVTTQHQNQTEEKEEIKKKEFLLLLVNLVRRRGFSLISFFLLLR